MRKLIHLLKIGTPEEHTWILVAHDGGIVQGPSKDDVIATYQEEVGQCELATVEATNMFVPPKDKGDAIVWAKAKLAKRVAGGELEG